MKFTNYKLYTNYLETLDTTGQKITPIIASLLGTSVESNDAETLKSAWHIITNNTHLT